MIKKFKLGAVDWKVKLNNTKLDDLEAYGYCNYDDSTLYVQDATSGLKRTPTAIEQSLYHEFVHAALDTLGYRELSNDETFVQGFSLLLHQFEKTKR